MSLVQVMDGWSSYFDVQWCKFGEVLTLAGCSVSAYLRALLHAVTIVVHEKLRTNFFA